MLDWFWIQLGYVNSLDAVFKNITKQPVLLCQQLRVARIQFQELFHIFELRLRILDFGIDTLQSSLKLCGIAADLNSDSLYSVCHDSASLHVEIKNARISPSIKKAPVVMTDAENCRN